ncbi:MAG: Uma2 family endonuclease [Oscillospiraceae bacterium]|nr:Uma2 family endonuclease [Oscillospiraceae bacterium]
MTGKQPFWGRRRVVRRYNAIEFIAFTETTDERERYELIDGRIYMMASPNVSHQDIAGYIYTKFRNYLSGKKCRAFISPLDVVLFKKDESKEQSQNVFQPDVFVVCDPDKIKEDRIYGAPDLVIEVVSPSSKRHDYAKKAAVYMRCGVREYWVADPMAKKIYVNINAPGGFIKYTFDFGDKIKVGIFEEYEDFYIDLTEI